MALAGRAAAGDGANVSAAGKWQQTTPSGVGDRALRGDDAGARGARKDGGAGGDARTDAESGV